MSTKLISLKICEELELVSPPQFRAVPLIPKSDDLNNEIKPEFKDWLVKIGVMRPEWNTYRCFPTLETPLLYFSIIKDCDLDKVASSLNIDLSQNCYTEKQLNFIASYVYDTGRRCYFPYKHGNTIRLFVTWDHESGTGFHFQKSLRMHKETSSTHGAWGLDHYLVLPYHRT